LFRITVIANDTVIITITISITVMSEYDTTKRLNTYLYTFY